MTTWQNTSFNTGRVNILQTYWTILSGDIFDALVLPSEAEAQAQVAFRAVEEILLRADPADAAVVAVVLLLVAVEEVAHAAVVLAEEALAALAALLGLLQQAAAAALHLGHAEAVEPVLLGAVVAQAAGVELPAARRPEQAAPPVVLAAALLLAARRLSSNTDGGF